MVCKLGFIITLVSTLCNGVETLHLTKTLKKFIIYEEFHSESHKVSVLYYNNP